MNPPDRLRVAVADDAMLLRAGIEKVLASGGIDVVASVGTAEELLHAVATVPLDAAVVDIRMPPSHTDEGVAALESLRAGGSRIGVLLLSMYATPEFAMRVMESGAGTGYLLKERVSEPLTLVRAVETVAAGGSIVDPEVVEALVSRTRAHDPLERLTKRETVVLELMASGLSNSGISQELFLGIKTVESHVRNIMQKLDLEDSPDNHRRVLAVLTLLGKR